MLRLLLHWVLSAVAVWVMAQIVPGITLVGPKNALIAALVIGLYALWLLAFWLYQTRFGLPF